MRNSAVTTNSKNHQSRAGIFSLSLASMLLALLMNAHAVAGEHFDLVFKCSASNDLYRVMEANGNKYPRYESVEKAVSDAGVGSGVLILADGYPYDATQIDPSLFEQAAKKKLRLYVEFPASLPDLTVSSPEHTRLERAVVASDVFGETLPAMRLLAIHDCYYVETQASDPYLVLAKVAGYDTAAYGLGGTKAFPLLFEHPNGRFLVSTTKLSQFVTARYAPKEEWQAVWQMIFRWLQPGQPAPVLNWTPAVRPTYSRDDKLPEDAVRQAIVRGIDWHSKARMLIGETWKDKYGELRKEGVVNRDQTGPVPDRDWPAGDGEYGVLEGFNSTIRYDGTQLVRWVLRSDCNGESSVAFALRSKVDGDERSVRIAANLLDWVFFNSGFFQKDPGKGNFGLIHWTPDNGALYGDNDIKIILSCMGTAAVLNSDRWDEVLLQNITANFRTTGRNGFRGGALNSRKLFYEGWQNYWIGQTVHYAPHYEAWIWASYLWAYDKTKDPLFLNRTREAIIKMMDAYPDGWTWTNGIQQERSRMLLTLAWLIRVDDKPQYRDWLKQLATDMRKCQDSSGAIREELGELGKGRYRPPRSNAEYGKHEASAIHENGDPMADMIYTCNFAFLGLHEAYAATGDELYREMANGLEEFFVRIQVRSEAHPELDGGWFRSFDYEKWDFWGANADAGWGAWAIEVGWTQGWIPTVMALRQLDLNLWDLTKDSGIAKHWKETKALMLPEDQLGLPAPTTVSHAGVGRKVTLAHQPDARYGAAGAKSLTDGLLAPSASDQPGWLGFLGSNLEATVDLGQVTVLSRLSAHFLQSTGGVYWPDSVEFLVSDNGVDFTSVAKVQLEAAHPEDRAEGALELSSGPIKQEARYVRIIAHNIGTIPAGHRAAGRPAWLFVDEVIVNPVGKPGESL